MGLIFTAISDITLRELMIYGFVAFCIFGVFKFINYLFGRPWFCWLFLAILAYAFLSHQAEQFWPHTPEIKTVSSVIGWAKESSPDPTLSMDNANWLSVTVSSTYEKPFVPAYGACYIHGPVYFDPQDSQGDNGGFISKLEASQTNSAVYVGERMLVVKLIPVSMVYDKKGMTPLEIARRSLPWSAPSPVTQEYMYMLTTPLTRLLPDDVVSCRFSETDFHVDSKIGWLSGGNPAITNALAHDNHVRQRTVDAVVEATKGQK